MKIVVTLLLFLAPLLLEAQAPGGEESVDPSDSLYIFEPARPLIDSSDIGPESPTALGLQVFFSNSGFGGGLFWQYRFTRDLALSVDFGFSGARNSDELAVQIETDPSSPHYGSAVVPGKINRVYQMPTMIGLKQLLFTETFYDNFRPFASLGAGGSLVIATPYDQEFFSAFGDASTRFAFGGFVGLGAEFTQQRPGIGIQLRYYYLPLEPGVESIQDQPITNFGGIFVLIQSSF